MSKMVRYEVDLDNLPPLTPERREELRRLAEMKDEDIDFSDIPEIVDFSGFKPMSFYRPVKQSTTVRVDADVLAWLKATGKGYQTRLNAILREAMLKEVSAPKR